MNLQPVPFDLFDIEMKLLFEGIFLRYGVDFRGYRFASLKRRVLLALRSLDCPSLSVLQARVLTDPSSLDQLVNLLAVSTTEMFRDPSYFRAIREQVVPILKTYSSFKVWIAGCSTGEEVYSMAILLLEEGLLNRAVLYATDIQSKSLERAEAGIYPLDLMPAYSVNYLEAGGMRQLSDYFQTAYGSALFDRKLRSQIVFSDHSLVTDRVFAEVELISCRNVLIYFTRELQQRVFQLFYDSLGNRGFLGLGSRETLKFSDFEFKFEDVNGPNRIYRKKGYSIEV